MSDTYTRQRYGLAAITAVTLGAILLTGASSCEADRTPSPSQSPVQVLPEECLALYGQPPYDVHYEDGTTVHVPAGRVQVDKLLGLPTAELKAGCVKIRKQYLKDHGQAQPSGWSLRTDFMDIADYYRA